MGSARCLSAGGARNRECVAEPDRADSNLKPRVARDGMSADEVSEIYPRPSPELCYRQSMTFVDHNPTSGQR